MNPPKKNNFSTALENLARLAPNWPEFNEGYENLMVEVHTPGVFEFDGMTISAPSSIYPPKRGSSTEFVTTHWDGARLPKRGSLLEIGTGAGALSLYALKRGWLVKAGDINTIAVDTARQNALTNGLELDVRESDLFNSFLGEKFDVILFNFPLYHKSEVSVDECALSDSNGSVAKRFFDEAHAHLNPGGQILFMYSNCSDGSLLDRSDWDFEMVGCDYFALGNYWRTLIKAKPTIHIVG